MAYRAPDTELPDTATLQQPTAAAADEPRSAIGAALRRKWPIVLLVTLVLAGVGVVVGASVKPTYTAEAQLNIGSPQVTAQAVPGYVQAAQSLAASYSRVATSGVVLDRTARALGTTRTDIAPRLTVSPVANSTIISIEASAPDERSAVTLARAEAQQLSTVVRQTQATQSANGDLLTAYQQAADRANRAALEVQRLERRRRADPSSVSSTTLAEAQTASDARQLEEQALSSQYVNAKQTDATAAGVQTLSPAAGTGSDRSSTVQKAGFSGGVAGVLIGTLLAVAVDRRRRARALGRLR